MYDHLMDKLHEELEAVDKKIAQGHDLDKNEYECAKVWAKTIVTLQTMEAMEEEYGEGEGQSREGRERNSYRGGSYRRSMYPNQMYAYRDGENYRRSGTRFGGRGSYHGEESDTMEKLQEAYDNASSEQERKTIRKLMDQMAE